MQMQIDNNPFDARALQEDVGGSLAKRLCTGSLKRLEQTC